MIVLNNRRARNWVASRHLWKAALNCALKYGWHPSGTAGGYVVALDDLPAAEPVVGEEDAQALGVALHTALAAIPDAPGKPRFLRSRFREQLRLLADFAAGSGFSICRECAHSDAAAMLDKADTETTRPNRLASTGEAMVVAVFWFRCAIKALFASAKPAGASDKVVATPAGDYGLTLDLAKERLHLLSAILTGDELQVAFSCAEAAVGAKEEETPYFSYEDFLNGESPTGDIGLKLGDTEVTRSSPGEYRLMREESLELIQFWQTKALDLEWFLSLQVSRSWLGEVMLIRARRDTIAEDLDDTGVRAAMERADKERAPAVDLLMCAGVFVVPPPLPTLKEQSWS